MVSLKLNTAHDVGRLPPSAIDLRKAESIKALLLSWDINQIVSPHIFSFVVVRKSSAFSLGHLGVTAIQAPVRSSSATPKRVSPLLNSGF